MRSKWPVIGIIGILLIVLSINWWRRQHTSITEPLNVTSTSKPFADENVIAVFDQDFSNTVTIALVVLTKPGFIVLETQPASGNTQQIGVSEVLQGEQINTEIAVELNSEDRQKISATLYQDNGDGTFSKETDTLIRDTVGTPISQIFTISIPTP